MTTVLRLSVLLILPLTLGGCLGPSTDDPYPVTDRGPNPGPLPGYRVHCQSVTAPGYFVFRTYASTCQQEVAPVPDGRAVRARG